MSAYEDAVLEMKNIDSLLDQGYDIVCVYENLSGMFVELKKEEEKKNLQLLTADARKYLSIKLQEKAG
jgi:isocitrate/isopropylmalate dehydrogenase